MTREQEDRVTPEQAGSQYDRNLFRFRKLTGQRPALSDAEGSPPHNIPPRSLALVVGSFVLAQVVLWSLVVLPPIVAHAGTGQSWGSDSKWTKNNAKDWTVGGACVVFACPVPR